MVSKKNALGKGLGALLENAKTDITSKPSNETNAQAGLISRINIFYNLLLFMLTLITFSLLI